MNHLNPLFIVVWPTILTASSKSCLGNAKSFANDPNCLTLV